MLMINTDEYIARKINDKYLFLEFSNGDSHILDETGTIFFDAYFDAKGDIAKAAAVIAGSFSNPPQQNEVQKDLNDFIDSLVEKSILIEGKDSV